MLCKGFRWLATHFPHKKRDTVVVLMQDRKEIIVAIENVERLYECEWMNKNEGRSAAGRSKNR